MTPQLRHELESLVPPVYVPRLAIAGGYAANPDLASDIDLWVLGIPKNDFDAVEQEIRDYLVASGRMRHAPLWADLSSYIYKKVSLFRVVTVQNVPAEVEVRPVQIILTEHATLPHLLTDFDISTHQVGYRLDDEQASVVMPTTTSTTESPRTLQLNTPETTLARLMKLCARYGVKPLTMDIEALQAATAQED